MVRPRPVDGLRAVLLSVAVVYTGQQMLTPVLPSLTTRLGLDPFAVGVIVSTAAAIGLVLSPVWGRRCGGWGLRRVLVAGVTGSGAALLVVALSAAAGLAGLLSAAACLTLLVVGRGLLFGVACSAVPVAAQAYVASATDQDQDRVRGLAALGACVGFGVVIGPPLGGLLGGLDVVVALVAPALLVLAVGGWLAGHLPPVPATVDAPSDLSPLDRRVRPHLLLAFGTFLSMTTSQVTLGFLVQDRFEPDLESAALTTGLLLVALGGAYVLTQALLVRWLAWPPVRLERIGTAVGLVGSLGVVVAGGLTVLATALAVSGVGMGLACAGFFSASSLGLPARDQGAVAGLLAAVDGLAFVVGPIAATALYGLSPIAPFIAAGAVLAALLPVAFLHTGTASTRSEMRNPSVSNPFDDNDGRFVVLRNAENQRSMWPVFVDVPRGWTVEFGPDDRQACLDHVERRWTDLRPRSLVEAMEARGPDDSPSREFRV